MNRYRSLLGLGNAAEESTPPADGENAPREPLTATDEAVIRIQDIRYITIDGNTYIYLIDDKDGLYRAKASEHEEMLLLQGGDTAAITYTGKEIVTCTKKTSGGINTDDALAPDGSTVSSSDGENTGDIQKKLPAVTRKTS